jgi:hypothetical protein
MQCGMPKGNEMQINIIQINYIVFVSHLHRLVEHVRVDDLRQLFPDFSIFFPLGLIKKCFYGEEK